MHAPSGDPLLAAMSGSCKYRNPSVFALRLTHFCTSVIGKFTRICGLHFSLTSEHKSRHSTQNLLMQEPISSATFKALVITKECVKSPTVNRGGLMLRRSVEAAPNNTSNSTERLVSNPIRITWLRFSMLLSVVRQISEYNSNGERLVYPQSWRSSLKIIPLFQSQRPSAEAIPTLLFSISKHPSIQSSLSKGQIAWRDYPPTRCNSQQLEHVEAFSQDNNPVTVSTSPVKIYKAFFPNSSSAFRSQEWFNRAMVVSFLIGSLA
jgi:hypothetical protein